MHHQYRLLKNIPVMISGHGTSGSGAFHALMAFILAGSASTMYLMPSMMPWPPVAADRAAKPRNGIIRPPMIRPTPLMVSETATAFRPPKMA